MSRYRGPLVRKARRYGVMLFNNGNSKQNAFTELCRDADRRNHRGHPGSHRNLADFAAGAAGDSAVQRLIARASLEKVGCECRPFLPL